MSRHFVRLAAVSLAIFSLSILSPNAATADATQLCRSMTSILLAPTDTILAPYIAAKDMQYGLSEQSDPTYIRVLAFVPGYGFLVTMQIGGTIMRIVSGAFEFPMGLFTLFREGAEKPLFKSQDETYAVYSEDWGPCPIRIGSSYNTINEF